MFFTPRKQIRLPPDEYLGPAISFVTICCESRRIIFQDPGRCKVAIEALKRTSQEAQFSVHAYCLMPDHVHFLLEGTGPGSNLVKFVSQMEATNRLPVSQRSPQRILAAEFLRPHSAQRRSIGICRVVYLDESCAKRDCCGASSVSVFGVIDLGLAEVECARQGLESAVEEFRPAFG